MGIDGISVKGMAGQQFTIRFFQPQGVDPTGRGRNVRRGDRTGHTLNCGATTAVDQPAHDQHIVLDAGCSRGNCIEIAIFDRCNTVDQVTIFPVGNPGRIAVAHHAFGGRRVDALAIGCTKAVKAIISAGAAGHLANPVMDIGGEAALHCIFDVTTGGMLIKGVFVLLGERAGTSSLADLRSRNKLATGTATATFIGISAVE